MDRLEVVDMWEAEDMMVYVMIVMGAVLILIVHKTPLQEVAQDMPTEVVLEVAAVGFMMMVLELIEVQKILIEVQKIFIEVQKMYIGTTLEDTMKILERILVCGPCLRKNLIQLRTQSSAS